MADRDTLQPDQPAADEPKTVPHSKPHTNGAGGKDGRGAGDGSPEPDTLKRTRVALLGSAELNRELVIALQRLGAEVIAVGGHGDAPLHEVADRTVVADLTDRDELTATIRRLHPKFVVSAAGAVAPDALAATAGAGHAELVPNIRSARLAADPEAMRRVAADQLGLPMAPFWFVGSVDELRATAGHVGFPMAVKPAVASFGEGQSVMLRLDDVGPAWQRAMAAAGPDSPARVLAETLVEVEHEVTLLTVSSSGPAGPTLDFCSPIGHRILGTANGQLIAESWQPHPLSPAALDAAKSIAGRVVRALGGRGMFGIELLVNGDEVYFSGLSLRPHDIALLTSRTQRLSSIELQARAILGLPIDAIMISPGAARLVYSARQPADPAPATDARTGPIAEARPATDAVVAGALHVPESDVLIFGPFDAMAADRGHPRRLSAALVTGPDVPTARERAERVSVALGRLWA
ncbi:MAG TPA: formate-dependent phosphoribosylglycinamide formyltransferase [Mycobacterium sp.]|nr:formate-dependent phosphoribosylglycinamide formyltransferase [Mycobacterium sp.]